MTKEEAIKWVDDRMCWGRGTFTENHPPNIDECWEAGCMAIEALNERPKGKWIYLKEDETLQPEVGWYGICKCSNCGEQESFPIDNTTKEIYGDDYCPTCGADMRGNKE